MFPVQAKAQALSKIHRHHRSVSSGYCFSGRENMQALEKIIEEISRKRGSRRFTGS